MSARDELAGLLFTTDNSKAVSPWSEWEHSKQHPRLSEYVYAMADALLGAGYRKPRTITKQHELAGVPNGSVVMDSLKQVWLKRAPSKYESTSGLTCLEPTLLPATVLYEPEAS